MPANDRGLLARLDALVELVADRHGLALLPGGRLAAAVARVVARATALAPAADRGSALARRDAVELLRAVAEGVGLLLVRGDRLEATSLRNAWGQIDEGLRAGLVYAAWPASDVNWLADLSRVVLMMSTYPGPAAVAHPAGRAGDADPGCMASA